MSDLKRPLKEYFNNGPYVTYFSFRELTLQKGDIVYIHKEVDKNWLEGEHHGRVGIFPANYVEVSFWCRWDFFFAAQEKVNRFCIPISKREEVAEIEAGGNF